MRKKIGFVLFLVSVIALGIVTAGCDAIGPSDTTTTVRATTTTTSAATTTTSGATTTTAAATTTTTAGGTTTTAAPTTTTTSAPTTTATTTSTSTTTTTLIQSLTINGTIYQNETSDTSTEVFLMMTDFSDRIPGLNTSQHVDFIAGSGTYSLSTDEASSFLVIAVIGDKPPTFIGGVGITTGEAALIMSALVFTCEAGVTSSESGQDFSLYTATGF